MSYAGKFKRNNNMFPIASTIYGTCTTEASVTDKVVICPEFDALIDGVTIYVRFTYPNTASFPTLNVNATGTKDIIGCNNTFSYYDNWSAGQVVSFTYDGTNWVLNSWTAANTIVTHKSYPGTIGLYNHRILISADESDETANDKLYTEDNLTWFDNTIDTPCLYVGNTHLSIDGDVLLGEGTWDGTNDSLLTTVSGMHTNLNGAIKNITRSNATFTATRVDGTTFTFTQKDYSASNGISLSGTTFSNSGVRSIATGSANGTIAVNKNGTTTDVKVKGLGTAAYTNTGNYVPSSGNATKSGNLTVTGTVQVNNYLSIGTASTEGGFEITHSTPFIDMHYNRTATDYTHRIIADDWGTWNFYAKNGSSAWLTSVVRADQFVNRSSKYVKENIVDISDDEAIKILQLRPVSFDYKDYKNRNTQKGLIAEEVLEVLPNMVIVPEGYTEFDPEKPSRVPSIDYSKFVPYLIKMVQIQQKQIDALIERRD